MNPVEGAESFTGGDSFGSALKRLLAQTAGKAAKKPEVLSQEAGRQEGKSAVPSDLNAKSVRKETVPEAAAPPSEDLQAEEESSEVADLPAVTADSQQAKEPPFASSQVHQCGYGTATKYMGTKP